MAASPDWKVYDVDGNYQAACKEVEAGACLMSLYGDGSTIRWGHRVIVWTEGAEGQPAAESWDHVAIIADRRVREHCAALKAKSEREATEAVKKHAARSVSP